MTERPLFYEVFPFSLNRHGEELCGDQVKVLRTPGRTLVVLSDGLGSGVKANILARLTAEIIVTMTRAEASLQDVIETVVGTLPVCKVRKIAYATFLVATIEHRTGRVQVVNFDSPQPFWMRQGRMSAVESRTETVHGKALRISEGTLNKTDFLGLISDGVLYAGMGTSMNFGWGWDQVAALLEKTRHLRSSSAEGLVRAVMQQTRTLYGGAPGDDATMVGIVARDPARLMLFTGPPVDKRRDEEYADRLIDFEGRRVVCGGTTANIVARCLGEVVATDRSTLREEVPPIGTLSGIDLVTEGILTINQSIQLLRHCQSDVRRLTRDRNGAALLARELLSADSIHILAGERINPVYQNPLLPRSISIRRNLVSQLVELLQGYDKEVRVEWC